MTRLWQGMVSLVLLMASGCGKPDAPPPLKEDAALPSIFTASEADKGPDGPKKPEVMPAEFGETVTVDGVSVTVTAASIGNVQLEEGYSRSADKGDLLTIRVTAKNANGATKRVYKADDEHDFDTPKESLIDDVGNLYKRMRMRHVADKHTRNMPLGAGDELGDVYIFEKPIEKADHVILSIPGEKLDVGSPFVFKIPAVAITKN